MNFLAAILMIAAIACGVFSYWGLNTAAGRNAFDEMAGMIPLAAAPAGFCFLVGSAMVLWRIRRARRNRAAEKPDHLK